MAFFGALSHLCSTPSSLSASNTGPGVIYQNRQQAINSDFCHYHLWPKEVTNKTYKFGWRNALYKRVVCIGSNGAWLWVLWDSLGLFGSLGSLACLQDTLTNVPGKRKTFETEKTTHWPRKFAWQLKWKWVEWEKQNRVTAIRSRVPAPLHFYGALSYSARKQNKKKERNHQLYQKSEQVCHKLGPARSLALA